MVKIKDKLKETDVKAVQGKVIYLKEGVSFKKYMDDEEEGVTEVDENEIISLDELENDIMDEDYY